ncbi:MAG: phosphotransferase [Cellulomonadaceae bacterium]
MDLNGADQPATPLSGGNASGPVLRIGDTVRKPWTPATPRVHAFMRTLRTAGVPVPRVLGRDAQGRQCLEYVPGPTAMDVLPHEDSSRRHALLSRAGALVRQIHDASAALPVPSAGKWPVLLPSPWPPDLVCHGDLAPWNLVLGERWVFIDWDGAGPSSRLWDLAYAAQTFTLNDSGEPVAAAAQNLRAFVRGYDADGGLRAALPQALPRRARAMRDLLRDAAATGAQPWAAMNREGHGAHWRTVTEHLERNVESWRTALR